MLRSLTVYGLAVLAVAILLIGLIVVVVIGSIRYGGPEGLVRRISAEVAVLRPHPQFVPTPLPTPADWVTNTLPAGITTEPTTPKPTEAIATSPTATPSPQSVAIATIVPTPTVPPTPAHRPAASSVRLTGFTHAWQQWNNCAPATLSMCLSQFGDAPTQEDLAAVLKGNPDDKNVSPEEIAYYVTSQGLNAIARVNGDMDRLRLFLSNGIPVMVESWLEEEPNDGMGHYRLVTGYDDATQQMILFDSYVSKGVRSDRPYEGISISYDEMLALWTVFNRAYIVIYPDGAKAVVSSILDGDNDDGVMWQRALQQARAEVAARPDDPFAWFNLGTDLVTLGRYGEAVEAYAKARTIGLPWRMLWYQFGPFRAYYETGLYEELIALADATIRTRGYVEEVYYWKGRGLASTGNLAGAREAWQQALELNPRYAEAARALSQIAEAR